MEASTTILLACLGFAAFVLLLLFSVFMKKECCSLDKNRQNDEEESVGLNEFQNNNEPPSITSYPRLTSPASAPILTDLSAITSNGRMRRNTSVHSIDIPILPEEIRAIQAGLLRSGEQWVGDETDCELLIGVYANSEVYCGYCVNLRNSSVEFYKIRTEHLPWQLVDQPDNTEFEMRNFFFALMLWNDEIEDAKRFNIYTGNRAINYDNNRLWRRAQKLLEHLMGCQRIAVGNDCRFSVSPRKDAKSFAIKIFPVEDLSQDNIPGFINFISAYYQIDPANFRGSHSITMLADDQGMNMQHNNVTENYQLYIDKVRNTRMKWTSPCEKCGYFDDEAASTLNGDGAS